MGEGPIITYFVEHSAAREWHELSVGEPIDAATVCDEKVRPSLTVVIAGWVMVAAIIGGATVVGIELVEAVTAAHSLSR